jgi:hypothetical protein
MAEYFELAAMRDRDESQPAGPAVLTAGAC